MLTAYASTSRDACNRQLKSASACLLNEEKNYCGNNGVTPAQCVSGLSRFSGAVVEELVSNVAPGRRLLFDRPWGWNWLPQVIRWNLARGLLSVVWMQLECRARILEHRGLLRAPAIPDNGSVGAPVLVLNWGTKLMEHIPQRENLACKIKVGPGCSDRSGGMLGCPHM